MTQLTERGSIPRRSTELTQEQDMTTDLMKLDQATRMLAEIRTVDDAKELIDLAEAARVYARQVSLGLEAQNHAAEIKLRAMRRAGKLTRAMDKAKAGRPPENRSAARTDFRGAPTYAELGLDKRKVNVWETVTTLPEAQFEAHIAKTKDAGKELTTIATVRLAKEHKRELARKQNRELVEDMPPLSQWNGEPVPAVALDPPWDWSDEGDADQLGRARPTYATMPFDEILALPVSKLAQDNAHIYLWITNRSLPKGFALLEAWGFRYITALTWCKPSFGMGNYFRGQTEHVLFGVRGSLPLLRKDVGTWFAAPRPGEHSSKPDAFYELVERCSPGPWMEMFQRKPRPGWIGWGAEVGT